MPSPDKSQPRSLAKFLTRVLVEHVLDHEVREDAIDAVYDLVHSAQASVGASGTPSSPPPTMPTPSRIPFLRSPPYAPCDFQEMDTRTLNKFWNLAMRYLWSLVFVEDPGCSSAGVHETALQVCFYAWCVHQPQLIKPIHFTEFVQHFTHVKWQGRHKLGDQLIRQGLLAQFQQDLRKVLRSLWCLSTPSKASASVGPVSVSSSDSATIANRLLDNDRFAKGESDLVGGSKELPAILESVLPRTEAGNAIGPLSVKSWAYYLCSIKTMLLNTSMPSVGPLLSAAQQHWVDRIDINLLQKANCEEFNEEMMQARATASAFRQHCLGALDRHRRTYGEELLTSPSDSAHEPQYDNDCTLDPRQSNPEDDYNETPSQPLLSGDGRRPLSSQTGRARGKRKKPEADYDDDAIISKNILRL